ncbi:MAG: hypothetical protein WC759_02535, partial [Candidatus Micrarchaeia archaeon]
SAKPAPKQEKGTREKDKQTKDPLAEVTFSVLMSFYSLSHIRGLMYEAGDVQGRDATYPLQKKAFDFLVNTGTKYLPDELVAKLSKHAGARLINVLKNYAEGRGTKQPTN